MAKEITIPRLGWSMEEGTFASWLKKEGEKVSVGDILFSLEGEKSLQDVESLDAGILRLLPGGFPKTGETVKVGQLIGFLAAEGEQLPTAAEISPSAPPVVPAPKEPEVLPPSGVSPAESGSQVSTPRARKVAAQLGVDINSLRGTGREGRIRERDVKAASESRKADDKPLRPTEASPVNSLPISSLRRTIAERMMASLARTAPVTLTTRADATNLVDFRNSLKATAEKSSVPSYTEIIVKLTAIAISAFPIIAARWEEDRIFLPDTINIGIAVDTDAGLLVPVIRDVARISLPELVRCSRGLIDAARGRSLKAEDMQGGVFTITNLGGLGVDTFTPIINFPEAAILGIGAIRRVPGVLSDGTIASIDYISLSLTFDHRVLDGAPAARFLQFLVNAIENPTARLLGFPPIPSRSPQLPA